MQSPSSVLLGHAAAKLVVLIAAILAWPASSLAQPTTPTPTPAQPPPAEASQPTAAERANWRKELLAVPRPTRGCYTAIYPERQWREVPCKTPPNKLYLPRGGGLTRLDTVGGAGPDFTAVVTGHITEAEGSFDSVTGVTATPAYSLQLNTDFFSTSTCTGSPNPACKGWEQFIYTSSGGGFIQYWLIDYGPPGTMCPMPRGAACVAGFSSTDGWCPQTLNWGTPPTPRIFCVVNSVGASTAPATPATSLGQLRVSAAASGVGGAANDAITVTVAGTPYGANGNNYFPDLGTQWQQAEFNVFGDGGGSQAVFNSGASATVRIEVASGTNLGPGCVLGSFTAESNNMTLQNFPPVAASGALPALVFAQTNPAPAGAAADCSDAVSLGDTHLTTFSGLHYDFQASGDFVLAESGSNFLVQTRQASGAPTWPDAAVNRAVATRMGKTTIAVCLAPTRVLVDGKARSLADHTSVSLPDDITISRVGDLYLIQRSNGDSVRAQLNRGAQPQYDWIDVSVNLGDRSQAPKVRGLLGNPDGNRDLLGMADGTILKQPVSFEDLYGRYGRSWRVPPRESLLCRDQRIEVGNPRKPFYANDLSKAKQERALATCTKAGVKQSAALADCILDVTVLGTAKAARGHARAPIPGTVWQAGAR
jgi:hypothetical protein